MKTLTLAAIAAFVYVNILRIAQMAAALVIITITTIFGLEMLRERGFLPRRDKKQKLASAA